MEQQEPETSYRLDAIGTEGAYPSVGKPTPSDTSLAHRQESLPGRERWQTARSGAWTSGGACWLERPEAASDMDWSTYKSGEIRPVLGSRQAPLGESVLETRMGEMESRDPCNFEVAHGNLNKPLVSDHRYATNDPWSAVPIDIDTTAHGGKLADDCGSMKGMAREANFEAHPPIYDMDPHACARQTDQLQSADEMLCDACTTAGSMTQEHAPKSVAREDSFAQWNDYDGVPGRNSCPCKTGYWDIESQEFVPCGSDMIFVVSFAQINDYDGVTGRNCCPRKTGRFDIESQEFVPCGGDMIFVEHETKHVLQKSHRQPHANIPLPAKMTDKSYHRVENDFPFNNRTLEPPPLHMTCNVHQNVVNESTTKQHSPAPLLTSTCNKTLNPRNQESQSTNENSNPPIANAPDSQNEEPIFSPENGKRRASSLNELYDYQRFDFTLELMWQIEADRYKKRMVRKVEQNRTPLSPDRSTTNLAWPRKPNNQETISPCTMNGNLGTANHFPFCMNM